MFRGLFRLIPLLAFLVVAAAAAQTPSATPLAAISDATLDGIVEVRGMVPLDVNGAPVPKRFVVRRPADARAWNGGLVIGAHGGSGGDNYDPFGKVIGTDETALDDVIGEHAVARGFAYASVDRDGAVSALDGLRLTNQFADIAAREIAARTGRAPTRRYLLGLSMGGGIARVAAEDPAKTYDGVIIVAGAGGDAPTRAARQADLARLWPSIDPRAHPGLPDTDPRIRAYAEAIGTPVAARRLWPYTSQSAVAAAGRAQAQAENSSGLVHVPTIEVVGTWDDFVIRELHAYRGRVKPPALHRLYEVEGVWHMSGDDDGVQSFQYIATRMGLDPDVARAMGEGPSYLPTVREAFDRLVRWVEDGVAAPPSQTVRPGMPLQ